MPLRTLAIETSHSPGSIACLLDEEVQRAAILPLQPQSAVTLAPAISQLLSELGWQPANLELIAVTRGPGSFTGLRIGITMAKLLAYALRIPVLGVLATDAIAAQVRASLLPSGAADYSTISVAIDALRQQVFWAKYPARGTDLSAELVAGTMPELLSIETWLANLLPGTVAAGSILLRKELMLPAGVTVAPAETWLPRAAMVGKLAYARYLLQETDDPLQLTPLYLRPSYAEEAANRLYS